MLILGIETSCDETAVAVVRGNTILSNCVSSSVELHSQFGGVIPEIACRYHVEYINHVYSAALKKAKVGLDDIGLIAVTNRPGLVGALLVGISMAKALSIAGDIPLIAVDHLIAHLYAAVLEDREVRYPFIGLIVSGGHTNLFLVKSANHYRLLGQTLDDAAGEAFDKVAKLLNLGYPGGPVIQNRAALGRVRKNLFPSRGFDDSLNFSFSGIKTSVLYYVRDRLKRDDVKDIHRHSLKLPDSEINDIAASFQDAVTEVLATKAVMACKKEGVKRLTLGGGVSANAGLREKIKTAAEENGIKLHIPSIKLCLDNAAMVAGFGGALYKKGVRSNTDIAACSSGEYKA